MGHLDDIIRRNEGASSSASLGEVAAKLVDKLPGGSPEPEILRPFQLPSQRKSSTPVWKVVALMVVLGVFVALYVWRMDAREREVQRQNQGQLGP
jgi:hypothetical protein